MCVLPKDVIENEICEPANDQATTTSTLMPENDIALDTGDNVLVANKSVATDDTSGTLNAQLSNLTINENPREIASKLQAAAFTPKSCPKESVEHVAQVLATAKEEKKKARQQKKQTIATLSTEETNQKRYNLRKK